VRSERESTRIVRSWLENGSTALPDRVLDAVLAELPSTPQRRHAWLPWRNPNMSLFLKLAAGAAAIVLAVVVGITLLPGGASVGTPAATPTPSPTAEAVTFGGTVQYTLDGVNARTVVEGVADGETVSGTAVSTLRQGVHTVRLACAKREGDSWALAGTVEATTIETEPVGAWSAVIVKDGSPADIGIWLSDDPSVASTCEAWLDGIEFATIDHENFVPVGSGELTPPPGLAP
jgi:hypothetical protein